ncbi:MAG: hypothetical protein E6772_05855 [Dysgonomonas sp.]|nr:hypothetical protein [Dysgonomonas sp.]
MLNSLKNISVSESFFYKDKLYNNILFLKKWLLPILLVVLIFMSCSSPEQKTNVADTSNIVGDHPSIVEETTNFIYDNLKGYWVLSDYYDRIIGEQTIVKYFTVAPSFSAWNILIKHDSIFSIGLLSNEILPLKTNSDTLALMQDGLGEYAFYYDKNSDNIILEEVKRNISYKKRKYIYRRVKEREPLASILGPDKRPLDIERGLYQLFVNNLLSGEYYTKATSERFVLKRDGGVNGFSYYNKYTLYPYFGTVHPYLPYDVVIFEDTLLDGRRDVYSWELNNDILTLHELVSYNKGKDYVLGSRVHKYAKKTQ